MVKTACKVRLNMRVKSVAMEKPRPTTILIKFLLLEDREKTSEARVLPPILPDSAPIQRPQKGEALDDLRKN